VTFFFAGTDTTAHTVALLLYYLGLHKDAQSELRKEVRTVMGAKDRIDYDDLNKLEKVNAFLKECFRMKNPTPGIIPRKAVRDHYIKDVFIRKGSYQSFILGWLVMVHNALGYKD
jgi:cytochrome P450